MYCGKCTGVFVASGPNGNCPICGMSLEVEPSVVPLIPSISDVADPGPSPVPQVSAPVGNLAVEVKKHQPFEWDPDKPAPPKRQPVDHQTSRLYWPFIIAMGKIAHYADTKYGSVEQYADGRLEGEKSPINHICGHLAEYVGRKPHDKWPDDPRMHLAAIAYNAMMEALYYEHGGPTVPDALYKKKV